MDRQLQIQILLDHYQSPRHRGALADADVEMPGGNPGCGDVVTVYIKGAQDHKHMAGVSYEGEGCTISMAASSMLLEQVVEGDLTMDEVLLMDYNEMIEQLGRQIVASRPKCATWGSAPSRPPSAATSRTGASQRPASPAPRLRNPKRVAWSLVRARPRRHGPTPPKGRGRTTAW